MNYIMIKVVGEKDNNGYSTEFFRVMKQVELLIPPQRETIIEYEEGKVFWIGSIAQAIKFNTVYLYEADYLNRYKFHGNKENYDKLKDEYIRVGWSVTHNGLKMMNRFYEESE